MRIGINGYEAVVPRFGYSKDGLPNRVGSSQYCYELLVALFNIDNNNKYTIFLPCEPTEDLPKESDRWHYEIVKFKRLWTAIGLSKEFFLKRPPLDIFFSPTHYLPLFIPFQSVISVLDLSYLHFSKYFKKADLFQLKYWTQYSAKKASSILTISQASKDDIIKMYKVPEDKVVVTYPGIKIKDPASQRGEQRSKIKDTMQNSKFLQEKYGIEGDYILFVGTLQPRKNISRLVDAFARLSHVANDAQSLSKSLSLNSSSLSESGQQPSVSTQDISKSAFSSFASEKARNLQLVIIGKKGWLYEDILKAPKEFGVEKKVRFLEFVSDEDLPSFYQNALCFVLPSLYEGFGLPILEAMQNGCPVITSNVSSLPEAGGDAAIYVNPEDVDDITSKIKTLIENKKLRGELIKKGYNQVRKFSWEKTARETLNILQQVANGGKKAK